MDADRLQLAVRDPGEPRAVSLEEYLRGRAEGTIDWEPYLGHVLLDLMVGGVQVWPYDMTVGDLPRVVVEFEQAAERLAAGREGLVRQALDDSFEAVLLLAEPDGAEQLSLSMIVITEPEPSRWYPALWWHEDNPVLYDYVREHRSEVATAPGPAFADLCFRGVSASSAWVVENLRREAERGRQVHDVLGLPFDGERFT
jgi:hypothetical protein